VVDKRDLQLVRLAVRRKWLTAEEGEDCLFLKRKFQSKYTIEEIIRRRQYLDDEAIEELTQATDQVMNRRGRTGIFRRPAPPPPPVGRATAPPPPRAAPVAPSVIAAHPPAATRPPPPPVATSTGSPPGAAPRMRTGGSASAWGARPVAAPPPPSAGGGMLTDDGKTSVVSLDELNPELKALLQGPAGVPAPPPGPPARELEIELDLGSSAGIGDDFLSKPFEADRTVVDGSILAALEAHRAKKAKAKAPTPPVLPPVLPPRPSAPTEPPVLPSPGGGEKTTIGVIDGLEALRRGFDLDEPATVSPQALREEEVTELPPAYVRPTPQAPSARLFEPDAAPPPLPRAQPVAPKVDPRASNKWSQARTVSKVEARRVVEPEPALAGAVDPFEAPLRDGEELAPGTTVGPFVIQRRVAIGGMGIVYMAEPVGGGPALAVKVLKASLAEAPGFLERFQYEAQAAAAIDSPYVTRVYDVGVFEGRHYVAMRYIDGWSLRERMEADPPTHVEALRIAADVARALAATEAAGVVHGDVKPDNVLVAEDGAVMLTDFGLARPIREAGARLDGEPIAGTPAYMAPEQAAGRPIDHRADLYALGGTLFHMIVGRPPYEGSSPISLLAKHISRDVPDLELEAPDVPPVVAGIVGRLLAKHPDDRFARAADVVAALERAVLELAPAAAAAAAVATPLDRAGVKKRTAVAAGIGLFLSIALPWGAARSGVLEWAPAVALLRAAMFGAGGAALALVLLGALGLVRRGELPLPGSTAWVVQLEDAIGALGTAALVGGVVLGPPAVLNVVVSAIGAAVLVSLLYGLFLRRAVAAARPDGGVGRMLAVLGDANLKQWRRYHAPMLATLAFLSGARFALLAYFHATGL
jgi:predicted Ser/Thr protein kinase